MDRLLKMQMELKKLQTEIDEVRLDENGEERDTLTKEEYDKVK